MVCLSTSNVNAQYTKDFNDANTTSSLSGECWSSSGVTWLSNNKKINGAGSLELALTANSTSSFTSAYLLPTSINFNISFAYKISNSISTMATRKLSVYVIDNYSGRTLVKEIPMVNGFPTTVQQFNESIVLTDVQSKRVFVEFSGVGDNNNHLILDDLAISAKATSTCGAYEQSVLPIRLLRFSGNTNNNKANLLWSVAENETGSHFEVEKSWDGKSFQAATIVFTTTTVGIENYQFLDPTELSVTTYYRIKTTNKNNSISYSNVISLKNGGATIDSKLTLLQNPVQSTLGFSFVAPNDEKAEVAIYNLAGVKVYNQNVSVRKGANSISFDMDSRMTKGNYIITVQCATSLKSSKFIKQ